MDNSNATELLLALAHQAPTVDDTDQLKEMLRTAHTAWCEGIAEVRYHVVRACHDLTDETVRQRCTAAGTEWAADIPRSEAVSRLAFAVWEDSPAAMAFSELETCASQRGVSLVDEVFE
ncbi:hypothetical protein ABT127_34670 [Streptomyces sp. NPDC001904]|uniref:hypothetical protein n=1 Tax=Streptomyces sp. NPDC001904 TaxID=3154531 RepID=UPI0033215394